MTMMYGVAAVPSGDCETVRVDGALGLGCQFVGVRQFVKLVVATSPFTVLLRRQPKHVTSHRQDVTNVYLPRRLLRCRRVILTGVVCRVCLDISIDVGEKQSFAGSWTQRGHNERFKRLTTSTRLDRRTNSRLTTCHWINGVHVRSVTLLYRTMLSNIKCSSKNVQSSLAAYLYRLIPPLQSYTADRRECMTYNCVHNT